MCQLIWIIAGLGAVALVGVMLKMKAGFGPFNLRVVGIVLISTFASLLALKDTNGLTAAMAIAGYLFGMRNANGGTHPPA
jgi:hypothetical protein